MSRICVKVFPLSKVAPASKSISPKPTVGLLLISLHASAARGPEPQVDGQEPNIIASGSVFSTDTKHQSIGKHPRPDHDLREGCLSRCKQQYSPFASFHDGSCQDQGSVLKHQLRTQVARQI